MENGRTELENHDNNVRVVKMNLDESEKINEKRADEEDESGDDDAALRWQDSATADKDKLSQSDY